MPRGFSPSAALDLTGVDPGADVEAERRERLPDREPTPDRPGRPVEQREEPVARRVDLLARVAGELTTHRRGVGDQVGPRRVSELRRALGRADEVGEENRREHAIGEMCRPSAGEELLDLVEDLIRLDERHVVVALQLDEARAGIRFAM